MKNTNIIWTALFLGALFLALTLSFSLLILGQTAQTAPASPAFKKVKEPELPADFKQWPNVFQRKQKLDDKNTATYSLYARKYKGAQETEFLELLEINDELIFSMYLNAGKENQNEFFIMHILRSDVYFQFDSRNNDLSSLEFKEEEIEREASFVESVKMKFGIDIDINSFYSDWTESFGAETGHFLENLSESEKAN